MKQMQWLNEPDQWKIDGDTLEMSVTGKTDFWRKTHYGFTIDDGPFCYCMLGGEFAVSVRLTGDYKHRFDQMGIMLRIDQQTWIKAGVEYVDGLKNVSIVVTHGHSDWSVIALDSAPKSIWIKAIRRLDAVEVSYSLDDTSYKMMRLCHFPDNRVAMVGMMGASPDGDGFDARFDHFKITHLPDQRRLDWLDNNQNR